MNLFLKNIIASNRVKNAIVKSEIIISIFLLYLSAQTPAKGDIKKLGINPDIIEIVIIIPD